MKKIKVFISSPSDVEQERSIALTLKYQQKFYQYNLGLNYKLKLYKNISIELEPSLVYALIKAKDTHISRNFHTLQNSKAFGYLVKLNTIYKINNNSKIKLSLNHKQLKDKSVDMDYYNILNQRYLTLPSSYRYKNSSIGLSYVFSF